MKASRRGFRKVLCLGLVGLLSFGVLLFGEDSQSETINAREISENGTTQENVVVDSVIDFRGMLKGSVKIISGGTFNLFGVTVG